jgi:hypothetical protein
MRVHPDIRGARKAWQVTLGGNEMGPLLDGAGPRSVDVLYASAGFGWGGDFLNPSSMG